MVVVLGIGFVSNLMIKPVEEKHFDADAVRAQAHRSSETALTGGTR